MTDFKIWVFGCSHIGNDIRFGRHTLKKACRDAEEYGFDIAVNLGDVCGKQGLPEVSEGQLWVSELESGLKNHLPSDIYSVCGNHDRTDGAGLASGDWFRQWVDPMGENPAISGVRSEMRRARLIPEGDWYAYKIVRGNVVMLFLSDVNRPMTPKRGELGGDPAGVVTSAQYQWWKDQCALHRGNGVVITFSHYLPKNTTAATGEYEGGYIDGNGNYQPLYHGPGYSGGQHSSYLAYVDEVPGRPFIEHLEQHPGDCALWFGAHNHVRSGKEVGGKGHVETLHGCTFIQTGHLTKYHHSRANESTPKSRFLTLEEGSDTVRMDAYFHTNDVIPKGPNPNHRTLVLPRAVHF